MSAWKRTLIWLFTFGFGLVWVLAFLLPTEVGGGLDRHGMYAPDLVGKRLYYTTGVRAAPSPLSENEAGAEIAILDLDNTAVRRRVIPSSALRRDDYKGQKRPQVLFIGNGFAMLYIGVGFDDKKRICLATSSDGTNWSANEAAVFEIDDAISAEGPHSFTVTSSGSEFLLHYLVFEKGRGVVRRAASLNLTQWQDSAFVLRLPEPESAEAFSLVPGENGTAVIVVSAPEQANRVEMVRFDDVGNVLERRALSSSGKLFGKSAPGFLRQIQDVKLVRDGEFLRALVVGGSREDDAPLRTALYEGDSLDTLSLVPSSQPNGTVAELSAPASSTYFDSWAGTMSEFIPIVMAFGIGLGLLSLVAVHGRRITKGGEPAVYSAIVLIGVVLMIATQIGRYATGESPNGFWAQAHDLLFYRLQFPLGSTMFGLLAAYLVSAAYRAFRIRTFDAAVLAAMAAFVILTQVPTAQFLTSFFAPESLERAAALDANAVIARNWALSIANDAVQRAVGFGAFIGAIAMAMRVWLSLDRVSG